MRRFYRFILLAFVLVAIGSVATHELASAAAPPYTIKMALVSDASACATAAVSASASGSIPNDNGGTVKYLCAEASDSTGAVVPSAPITFSVSLDTWIGYQFASAQTFRGLYYQEGAHYPDGGWWNSLRVQVRSGGVWNDVSSQVAQPSYPSGTGAAFATYMLTFTPVTGDAIRILGTPGGTAVFVSVAEMRVYGEQPASTTPTVTPTPPTAATGTITAGTPPPANGGFAVFVFGGGTNAQLASAAGCALGRGVFWVTNAGGEFVTYVVRTQISAVNALWNSMFANGITANQPMIGTCR